jgi:hypothetical protein
MQISDNGKELNNSDIINLITDGISVAKHKRNQKFKRNENN